MDLSWNQVEGWLRELDLLQNGCFAVGWAKARDSLNVLEPPTSISL
jgi:hypothetical protein